MKGVFEYSPLCTRPPRRVHQQPISIEGVAESLVTHVRGRRRVEGIDLGVTGRPSEETDCSAPSIDELFDDNGSVPRVLVDAVRCICAKRAHVETDAFSFLLKCEVQAYRRLRCLARICADSGRIIPGRYSPGRKVGGVRWIGE